MSVASFEFYIFLLIAVSVFHLSPRRYRAVIVFPLTNLVFLWLVLPSWQACLVLAGFVAVIALAVWSVAMSARRAVLALALTATLLVFGWIKAYYFLGFLPLHGQIPAALGLSYILIRGLQLILDLAQDPTLRPNPLSLVSFLIAWPCLVSGPIQRWQDFQAQEAGMSRFVLGKEIINQALSRIVKGSFFVLVLADATKHFWLALRDAALSAPSPLGLGAAQGAFFLHLTFDFMGYTEIVIGAAYLIGLTLPENFNQPWLAQSYLDFWSRWHMTLASWFKTYIFNPLLTALTRFSPTSRWSNLYAVAAFFVTFFLVGIWHGATSAFMVCGLFLGLGASLNQLFRATLRNRLGKKRFNALNSRWLYNLACASLTLAYIAFSISPLWLSSHQMGQVAALYGLPGLLAAEGALILIMALAALVIHMPRAAEYLSALARQPWLPGMVIGLELVAINLYTFLFPHVNYTFIYEAF